MPSLESLNSDPMGPIIAGVVIFLLGVFLGLWRKWSITTELRYMVAEQRDQIEALETALDLERQPAAAPAFWPETVDTISIGAAAAGVIEQMPQDDMARRAAAAAELRDRAHRLVTDALGFLREAEAFEREASASVLSATNLRAAE